MSTSDLIAAARTRLDGWLLGSAPQIADGAHAGAVAGSISAAGEIVYVYPEITGYYLQWLAWRSRAHPDPALAARAHAAAAWLGRWARQPVAATRVYVNAHVHDWRNDAVFTFDVAMAIRGIGSAVRQKLIEPDRGTVEALASHLEQLVGDDGAFVACRALGEATLPTTWSTCQGPFLAKAAAGVLDAAAILEGIPSVVTGAAAKTFERSVAAINDAPHDALHPQLYAFEGVLAGRSSAPNALERALDALLDVVGRSGGAPELASHPHGVQRVDVLAQLVRVVRGFRHSSGCAFDVDKALQRLASAVDGTGAVPFAFGVPGPRNVWAAMFVSQAFCPDFPAGADSTLIV